MRLDVACREPPAIQRQDLVVEPLEATLALADDLRLEAAVPVPRRVQRDLAVLGDQRLRTRPVAACGRAPRRPPPRSSRRPRADRSPHPGSARHRAAPPSDAVWRAPRRRSPAPGSGPEVPALPREAPGGRPP